MYKGAAAYPRHQPLSRAKATRTAHGRTPQAHQHQTRAAYGQIINQRGPGTHNKFPSTPADGTPPRIIGEGQLSRALGVLLGLFHFTLQQLTQQGAETQCNPCRDQLVALMAAIIFSKGNVSFKLVS